MINRFNWTGQQELPGGLLVIIASRAPQDVPPGTILEEDVAIFSHHDYLPSGVRDDWYLHPADSSDLHTGMVGGLETSCHTRLPSLNYAGINVQPGVITHSLTHAFTHSLSNRMDGWGRCFVKIGLSLNPGLKMIDAQLWAGLLNNNNQAINSAILHAKHCFSSTRMSSQQMYLSS
jgi:hypothetical protein